MLTNKDIENVQKSMADWIVRYAENAKTAEEVEALAAVVMAFVTLMDMV